MKPQWIIISLIVLIGLICYAADNVLVDRNVLTIAEIHAGACFGKDTNTVDLILIETWDDKFFLGNYWGNKYKMYSTFHKTGGATAQECAAYLRGEGYKYIGKAE